MKQDKVLEFIQRRFKNDCHWIDGNCFYFSIILKARFPQAVILYDVIYGHFFVNINGDDYDWTGRIQRKKDGCCVEWDDFENYDETERNRIIRDCVL